ncbi:MAG: orotate phosphoribosyltransferase [Defluviitaleaceae bacterium]|nr:orotate phosphoribosyltransferase [Defluviitaleaceae bacterium]MCL2836864.1 orotate phosphoribosyltransferase [Defluviitaleaceae bacterium]
MQIPAYKANLIELMAKSGVLLFGDFKTKSGRQSPYFVNTGYYKTGAQADALSDYYAALINEKLKGSFDALFGPAYKGIPLCALTAAALWRNWKIDTNYCFNRKEAKDHGEGGVLVGYQPKEGDKLLLIEDVISAGTAVREIMLLLLSAGAAVTDMVISVNRMEKGYDGLTATEEIKRDFGIDVHPIVTVFDILAYLYNKDVDGKIYINDEVKARMEEYIGKYCVY